jgi:hypothetical protein
VERLQDPAPALVAQTERFVDDDASPQRDVRRDARIVPLRAPLGLTSIYGLFIQQGAYRSVDLCTESEYRLGYRR